MLYNVKWKKINKKNWKKNLLKFWNIVPTVVKFFSTLFPFLRAIRATFYGTVRQYA